MQLIALDIKGALTECGGGVFSATYGALT